MSQPSTRKPYYVTTAILYANDTPHVGHAFEMLGADVMVRAKRMLGYDVYFQTGTDEHGQKMLEYAQRNNMDPRAFADVVAPKHKDLWDALHISYNRFFRTTSDDHQAAVERFWHAAAEKGDIYKGKYEGWYCVTDENFVLESQTTTRPDAPGKHFCPECSNELTWKSEESYFFRWSKYQSFVEQWLKENPQFIQPGFRANEMINSFLKPGLQDISISRSTITWGIPVPGDPEHVIYVWFDALINYVTGVGYAVDDQRFARFWPANLHIVGKDILKFHTLLWPAMCESVGIAPPRQVFGHGFVSPKPVFNKEDGPVELRPTVQWTPVDGGVQVTENDAPLGLVQTTATDDAGVRQAIVDALGEKVIKAAKMSKSRGNVVNPYDVLARFGGNPDPLRFFLLREIDFGGDGYFSDEALQATYNADLADKIGNLLSRTLTMVDKYQGGVVNPPAAYDAVDEAARAVVMHSFGKADGGADVTRYEALMDACRFCDVIEAVLAGAQRLNQYITETQPFKLAKDPEQADRLGAILYTLVEGLRVLAVQLYPFVPGTSEKIWQQVGGAGRLEDVAFEDLSRWGYLQNAKTTRGENLFPKEQ